MAIAINVDTFKKCIGYEALAVDNTAGGLAFTRTKYRDINGYDDATVVLVTADGTAGTNDVRFTLDGTAPVATTTGHLLKAGDSLILHGFQNIIKFRAIREGVSSGTLQCSYFN